MVSDVRSLWRSSKSAGGRCQHSDPVDALVMELRRIRTGSGHSSPDRLADCPESQIDWFVHAMVPR